MAEYYFNFPSLSDLTSSQRAAVDEFGAIALSGGPGTGKSLVSLWRHIIKHNINITSQLLTYTNTLAYYLKMISLTENEEAGIHVDTILSWNNYNEDSIDEIIVDEAQDVEEHTYSILNTKCSIISYGADERQSLYKKGCSLPKLRNLYPNNLLCILDNNYRNTKKIMQFCQYAFPNIPILQDEIDSCKNEGYLPHFYITNNNQTKINNQIILLIDEIQHTLVNPDIFNIGVLTPFAKENSFYNETYTAKYYYDILLPRYDCSFYDNTNKSFSPIKNIHITPYKSSKGIEFDAVILIGFDSLTNDNIYVNTPKDFFVAASRAKSRLYIFSSCDFQDIPDNILEKHSL